jgi:hypothetical protein
MRDLIFAFINVTNVKNDLKSTNDKTNKLLSLIGNNFMNPHDNDIINVIFDNEILLFKQIKNVLTFVDDKSPYNDLGKIRNIIVHGSVKIYINDNILCIDSLDGKYNTFNLDKIKIIDTYITKKFNTLQKIIDQIIFIIDNGRTYDDVNVKILCKTNNGEYNFCDGTITLKTLLPNINIDIGPHAQIFMYDIPVKYEISNIICNEIIYESLGWLVIPVFEYKVSKQIHTIMNSYIYKYNLIHVEKDTTYFTTRSLVKIIDNNFNVSYNEIDAINSLATFVAIFNRVPNSVDYIKSKILANFVINSKYAIWNTEYGLNTECGYENRSISIFNEFTNVHNTISNALNFIEKYYDRDFPYVNLDCMNPYNEEYCDFINLVSNSNLNIKYCWNNYTKINTKRLQLLKLITFNDNEHKLIKYLLKNAVDFPENNIAYPYIYFILNNDYHIGIITDVIEHKLREKYNRKQLKSKNNNVINYDTFGVDNVYKYNKKYNIVKNDNKYILELINTN